MKNNFNVLVDLLLDNDALLQDRDDAAMDLFEFDDDHVVQALLKVAKRENEDPVLLNSCGESLGSIWVKRDHFDKECYSTLTKTAKQGVNYTVKNDRPDWIYLLEF